MPGMDITVIEPKKPGAAKAESAAEDDALMRFVELCGVPEADRAEARSALEAGILACVEKQETGKY